LVVNSNFIYLPKLLTKLYNMETLIAVPTIIILMIVYLIQQDTITNQKQ